MKIGVKKDGRITAGDAELRYQGGAFPGSLVEIGAMTAFACYDLENVQVVGYDVVSTGRSWRPTGRRARRWRRSRSRA